MQRARSPPAIQAESRPRRARAPTACPSTTTYRTVWPAALAPVAAAAVGRDVDRALLEQPRSADEDVLAVDRGAGAATGQRFESGGRAGGGAGTLRAVDDGPRERVLRVGFDRGRQGEHTFASMPDAGTTVATTGSPFVRVPVLSKITVSSVAGAFEREAVLHEQAVARTERGRDGDDERDREAERVGARDDQDGGRPDAARPRCRRASTSRRA